MCIQQLGEAQIIKSSPLPEFLGLNDIINPSISGDNEKGKKKSFTKLLRKSKSENELLKEKSNPEKKIKRMVKRLDYKINGQVYIYTFYQFIFQNVQLYELHKQLIHTKQTLDSL